MGERKSNSTLRNLCVEEEVGGGGRDRAEHSQFSGGFGGLHRETLASYMRPLSSNPETVKLLSVQSVSSCLHSLFPLCLCSLFPSLPQWRCGTNNATSTHCLRHCMQRFPKFRLFLTLSLRIKRCGRHLRQSVRNKSKLERACDVS